MVELFMDIPKRQRQCFENEGLVVQVGNLGLVGSDLVATRTDRARIVALAYGGNIAIRHTALWIYTGNVTPNFHEHVETIGAHSDIAKRRKYAPSDLVTIGSLLVTTPERTLIDLLLDDVPCALANIHSLVRAGCDLTAAARRAGQIEGIHGIARVRTIARQLPASVVTRRSDSRFDPTTR
ncbi:hypothetical protein J2S49_000133 [Arcanobacterium wilhelmae]|uniref:AbiEi antitoxin C-terminal domain-containing protein n=1 Tax=Arcanobacterium wilhelmae TaxID=1803177 RepID=A0ABT9N8M8_9ACTO|nr:hypothetical protein [Arcanobacterium wilhelmae]MDP9800057.1 hypothetical protein [Arcanobacterium wilhelmae]WFN89552.1 hypothetical protein P8A24_04895 [Arcanobacterium wilhelmae]